MTIDFFLKSFDFNDMDILNIELKDYILKIDVSMFAHMELIANGYRPELDVQMKKTFIFRNASVLEKTFSKPYCIEVLDYSNEGLSLNICNNKVIICAKDVEIVSIK